MAQDHAASISGQLIRVSRLESDGSIATGPSASYVMRSFISVSFTPEYEDGDEITQKNAAGEVCVSYQLPDTLKRVTLELAICEPDPEFTEILAGGDILVTSGQSVGYQAPEIGVDAMPFGAALEAWSLAIQNGKPAANNRYWHWIFPYVVMRPSGDRVMENGLLANTFEGWGVGNASFGGGPDESWAFGSDRAWAYARTDSIPASTNGYVAVV